MSRAQDVRFGFREPERGAAALAELQRRGFPAWGFAGDDEFAVTVYVDVPDLDLIAVESIVHRLDDTAVAIRPHAWNPLTGT